MSVVFLKKLLKVDKNKENIFEKTEVLIYLH